MFLNAAAILTLHAWWETFSHKEMCMVFQGGRTQSQHWNMRNYRLKFSRKVWENFNWVPAKMLTLHQSSSRIWSYVILTKNSGKFYIINYKNKKIETQGVWSNFSKFKFEIEIHHFLALKSIFLSSHQYACSSFNIIIWRQKEHNNLIPTRALESWCLCPYSSP